MHVSCLVLIGMLSTISEVAHAEVVMADTFTTTPDRTWIGRDWWANRLQDWAIEDGRLICLEARANRPVRTAHWISRNLGTGRNDTWFMVDIEPATPGARAGEDAVAGFLLGSGGPHVDHRLTAQVHHHPAEDGGLLAVVDGDGIVSLRRFDMPGKVPGSWSIGTRVGLDSLPLLKSLHQHGKGFDDGPAPRVRLEVRLKDNDLLARAVDPVTGHEYSFAETFDVPSRYLDGGIALVSHRGPEPRGRGFAFENLQTQGDRVHYSADRTFGPVLAAMYTVDEGVLKLTAQMPPLGEGDSHAASLQVQRDTAWDTVAEGTWDDDSATFGFRVENWDATVSIPYRITYLETRLDAEDWPGRYEGVIRAEPTGEDLVLAAMNCQKVYTGNLKWNHDGLWMPHIETVVGVEARDPDLLFFAGDQIYEGDLTPVDARTPEIALLDYLYKWYRFCWSFRDLARTRPTIAIPDDHDVYHGNIWGAGGKKAERTDKFSAQDSGGYKKPPRVVNAVHRTQVSHLPDPVDPEPIEQGISVYYTDLDWGGVSFAILADRMFKSSPAVMVPEGQFQNGWAQAEGFDPATQSDVPGAQLLGSRQEAFLESWAVDWDHDDWAKAVLSQTLFCNLATLPEGAASGGVLPGLPVPGPGDYPDHYRIVADGDSNGWPQTPRDRAVESMRRGGAIHICGDQHLGSTLRYGVDRHGDAGWAFCVPAISNTWPRRWFPPEPGGNQAAGAPPYTGDFRDGFGNLMTVQAVANPVKTGRKPTNLYNRMPGWGIIRFHRPSHRIVMECWPRWTAPGAGDAEQYPGWPVVFDVEAGYGTAERHLARITCEANIEPLVQVRHHPGGEIHSVRRLKPGGGLVRVDGTGPWNLEASTDGITWTVIGTELAGKLQDGEQPTLGFVPVDTSSR